MRGTSRSRALRGATFVELPLVGYPAHAMYPPLYPALLAALGVTVPGHAWIGVLANMALSVLMLVMVANVAVRLSPWLAEGVTLVCAVNPMLLYVASGIHSEPMLAATAALAIAMAAGGRRDARALALLSLMAIAAALSRSIGLAVVVATFALFAFERRWHALVIYSTAAALTAGSWLVWTVRTPAVANGGSRLRSRCGSARGGRRRTCGRGTGRGRRARVARAFAARLVHNAPAYLVRELPTVFAIPTREGTRGDNVAWLVVFLVTALVGFAVLIRRAWLLTAYLAVAMTVLLLSPYVDKRLLAPLIPPGGPCDARRGLVDRGAHARRWCRAAGDDGRRVAAGGCGPVRRYRPARARRGVRSRLGHHLTPLLQRRAS
jgi:hypothetical protein